MRNSSFFNVIIIIKIGSYIFTLFHCFIEFADQNFGAVGLIIFFKKVFKARGVKFLIIIECMIKLTDKITLVHNDCLSFIWEKLTFPASLHKVTLKTNSLL